MVIGGAGGVGSIMIQLAKKLTGLTVIATASRPETIAWVKKMGADHVINHRESLVDQVAELGLAPQYVAALTGTDGHFPAIVELIKPRVHVLKLHYYKPEAPASESLHGFSTHSLALRACIERFAFLGFQWLFPDKI